MCNRAYSQYGDVEADMCSADGRYAVGADPGGLEEKVELKDAAAEQKAWLWHRRSN